MLNNAVDGNNKQWGVSMANTRFTDDELFLLISVPSMIGSTVSMSESSGVIGTVKEAMANAKSMMGGIREYPENDIIQSVLPALEDRQEALQHAKEFRNKAISRIKEKGIKSKQMLKHQLIEDCNAVARILDDKASDTEKSEYKEWAMSVAEQVAKAAKEGGFLGFGGEQVSEGEVSTINEISKALGTESPFAIAG